MRLEVIENLIVFFSSCSSFVYYFYSHKRGRRQKISQLKYKHNAPRSVGNDFLLVFFFIFSITMGFQIFFSFSSFSAFICTCLVRKGKDFFSLRFLNLYIIYPACGLEQVSIYLFKQKENFM